MLLKYSVTHLRVLFLLLIGVSCGFARSQCVTESSGRGAWLGDEVDGLRGNCRRGLVCVGKSAERLSVPPREYQRSREQKQCPGSAFG